MNNEINVHTDGGARGNPGPAAIGVVISRGNTTLTEFGKIIGDTTNNVAEYAAVREALIWLKNNPVSKEEKSPNYFSFYLDSALVVHQLNGYFKVKDPTLRLFLSQIRILEQEVNGQVKYNLIPREENQQADFLVNRTLDSIQY
jgi:ribonuclease HI